MKLRRLSLLGAFAFLTLACSRGVEPGLYTTQEGFVRVYVDSLGTTRALMYRDTSSVWADTVSIDLKAEKLELVPYEAPEFRRFPDRELYKEPTYRVGVAEDVVYGRVIRNGGDTEEDRMDLTMDIYTPHDGSEVARPLLVTLHGGAFQNGDKRDSSLVEWCRYFASLGYVAASVDYRQGCRKNEKATDEAMYRALKDASAAIRFLLKRDSLLIHSERIFAAGADAGGITALNLAFMREENMPEVVVEEEDTTIVTHQALLRGFDIRAVANLWGAVADTAILTNAAIPVISFQSREDPVIPYGKGFPFDDGYEEEEEEREEPEDMFDWLRSVYETIVSALIPEEDRHPFREMYGAGVIHRVLKRHRVTNELHAFNGARHNLFLGDDGIIDYPVYDEIKEQTAAFFASKMVVAPVSLRQDPEDPQLFIIDNTEVETIFWNVEGGVLVGRGDDAARVLMFPDAPVHSVSISGLYASGMTFYDHVDL